MTRQIDFSIRVLILICFTSTLTCRLPVLVEVDSRGTLAW